MNGKILLQFFLIISAVFAGTYIGVELFRRWSLKREILDMPNERSSHTIPTPRGGGLIIFLISVIAFSFYFGNFGRGLFAFLLGSFVVAGISLIDDIKNISPFLRIFFHGLAAFIAVWAFGGFEWILAPFYGIVSLGFAGKILAFFWIVWLVNAYNFMDGIDGIAALQAVTAGIGWGLAGSVLGSDVAFFFGTILAASSMGFLLHNWQPAKIFMGDVGSAFLGYSFAVLPLFVIKNEVGVEKVSIVPWIGVILVWFFVFDSVLTFLRRLLRGEKVWQAHREHFYQRMVIGGQPHYSVTTVYGVLSAVLVIALTLSLKYSLSFEKTVLMTVFFESLLLLILQRVLTNKNFTKNAKNAAGN